MAVITRVAANFEEGSAGATVNPAVADLLGIGMQQDGGSTITYTTESHGGALAARLASASGLTILTSLGREVQGGGGWFKIKAVSTPPPSSFESEVFAGVNITIPPFGSTGVYLRRVPGATGNFGIYSEVTDTLIHSTSIIFDQWLYLSIDYAGHWEFGDAGGIIWSGVETPPATDLPVQYLWSASARLNGGITLVDDLWVTSGPTGPAVRLYPRDDGRGMSSAPRIHPAPRSGRIIGGYQ